MTEANREIPRPARAADYDTIAGVVDDWWGRPVLSSLPRLFLDHFHRTSLIAEATEGMSGFLVGIVSPSELDQAYIHFVGVCPQARKNGFGPHAVRRILPDRPQPQPSRRQGCYITSQPGIDSFSSMLGLRC